MRVKKSKVADPRDTPKDDAGVSGAIPHRKDDVTLCLGTPRCDMAETPQGPKSCTLSRNSNRPIVEHAWFSGRRGAGYLPLG